MNKEILTFGEIEIKENNFHHHFSVNKKFSY